MQHSSASALDSHSGATPQLASGAVTLIKMAHDIGAFFEAMPDQKQAARDVAAHIQRFWELRMQRALLQHLEEHPDTPLREIVRQAVVVLRGTRTGGPQQS